MAELWSLTLAEARRLLAARAVSAVELLDATLTRIAATEPRWHAYVEILEASARAEAARSDAALAAGDPRPLEGLPIAVKDMIHVAGSATRAGSQVLPSHARARDSAVVERLRAAGAVIVGKTVVQAFGWGVGPAPTRNAWQPELHPGGSSPGSAVAVALGSASAAIATDSAGSVRNPAARNGVVGLKPTFGRVSAAGTVPMAPALDHVGPLARTVEDAAIVLGAIAGHDPQDPWSLREPVPDFCTGLERGVERARIGVERARLLDAAVDPEFARLLESAIADLAALGAEIVEVDCPALDLVVPAGWTILLVEAASWHEPLLRTRGEAYDAPTRRLVEQGLLIPGARYVQAQRARVHVRDAVRRLYEEARLDVLLAPTMTRPAGPFGDEDYVGMIGERCRLLANVTGQPAISLPCGVGAAGDPVGLQLVGRPLAEPDLCRIAHAFERVHGRRHPRAFEPG